MRQEPFHIPFMLAEYGPLTPVEFAVFLWIAACTSNPAGWSREAPAVMAELFLGAKEAEICEALALLLAANVIKARRGKRATRYRLRPMDDWVSPEDLPSLRKGGLPVASPLVGAA